MTREIITAPSPKWVDPRGSHFKVAPDWAELLVERQPIIIEEPLLPENPLEASMLVWARRYHDCGLRVMPLSGYSKKPLKDWRVISAAGPRADQLYRVIPRNNVAVRTGRRFGGLVGIVCMNQEAYTSIVQKLGREDLWVVKEPKGSYQIWFLLPDGKVKSVDRGQLKIIGEGSFLIAPPSFVGGRGYEWMNIDGDQPPVMTPAELGELIPGISIKQVLKPFDPDRVDPIYSAGKNLSQAETSLVGPYLEWANNHSWTGGTTGITDRKVFIGLCHLAAAAKSIDDFPAPDRPIGEYSGVDKGTASRSVHRLIAAGFIKLVSKEPDGNHYRFTVDIQHAYTNPGYSVRILDVIQNHDVWRRGGITGAGSEIYFFLLRISQQEELLDIREIADGTGRSRNTVKRNLDKLKDAGLVYEEGGKWLANWRSRAYFDQLAEKLGTSGKGRHQKAMHNAQREYYNGLEIAHTLETSRT